MIFVDARLNRPEEVEETPLRGLPPPWAVGAARPSSAAAAHWSSLRQAGGTDGAVGRPRHGREAAGGARRGEAQRQTHTPQTHNTRYNLNFLD